MPATDAPEPTGRTQPVVLTGKLFPWRKGPGITGLPVFLAAPGSNQEYLPCFDDPDVLRGVLALAGASFDSIKQIDDGIEFLSEMRTLFAGMRIMVNPYFTVEGKVRWIEVVP